MQPKLPVITVFENKNGKTTNPFTKISTIGHLWSYIKEIVDNLEHLFIRLANTKIDRFILFSNKQKIAKTAIFTPVVNQKKTNKNCDRQWFSTWTTTRYRRARSQSQYCCKISTNNSNSLNKVHFTPRFWGTNTSQKLPTRNDDNCGAKSKCRHFGHATELQRSKRPKLSSNE